MPSVAGAPTNKASARLWADRRQELVFIGIDMDEDKVLTALDDALVTSDEFALGPVSWRHWRKLVMEENHHHHDHEEHEDCTTACDSERKRHELIELIEDWFPEICDPDILGLPEASVARLSVKELKSALAIRDIPFSSDADRRMLEEMLIPVW